MCSPVLATAISVKPSFDAWVISFCSVPILVAARAKNAESLCCGVIDLPLHGRGPFCGEQQVLIRGVLTLDNGCRAQREESDTD